MVRGLVFVEIRLVFQSTLLPSLLSESFFGAVSDGGLGKKTERNTDEQEELDWTKMEVARAILCPF